MTFFLSKYWKFLKGIFPYIHRSEIRLRAGKVSLARDTVVGNNLAKLIDCNDTSSNRNGSPLLKAAVCASKQPHLTTRTSLFNNITTQNINFEIFNPIIVFIKPNLYGWVYKYINVMWSVLDWIWKVIGRFDKIKC